MGCGKSMLDDASFYAVKKRLKGRVCANPRMNRAAEGLVSVCSFLSRCFSEFEVKNVLFNTIVFDFYLLSETGKLCFSLSQNLTICTALELKHHPTCVCPPCNNVTQRSNTLVFLLPDTHTWACATGLSHFRPG